MVARTWSDGAVARVMCRQLGLITTRQATAAGVSRSTLSARTADGTLVRVLQGVYAAADAPRTWEQSTLAACLALGPDACVSHTTAATLWHFGLPTRPYVEVTVPSSRSVRLAGEDLRVHRTTTLLAADRTHLGRYDVTTVPRTLIDLASSMDDDTLAKVAGDALARRLLTPARLADALDRAARHRPGEVAALRRVVAPWLAGARLESVAEASFLRAISAARLPAPRTQYRVETPDGAVYRLDFAWPQWMVLLEVDSYRWHVSPDAHAADSARANRLAALGWTVLRATPRELDQSSAVIFAALEFHLDPARRHDRTA
jgi:very-short-patch-repair endonuclease